MQSLWQGTSKPRFFGSLDKDIKTDVLIIGGGMAGVLCAYMLKNAGVNYVLVEAKTLTDGTTKNTTAKITSQHALIYDKLINEFNEEKARLYLRANEEAIGNYRSLCRNIDCDFEEKSSYVYSLNGTRKIEKEVKALQRLGLNAPIQYKTDLPFGVECAVEFRKQAQFNPLKFIYALSENLNVYEHTEVKELVGNKALCEKGSVEAEKIIVATHFPFINKHGYYFAKLYQQRSYAIAIENAKDVGGMYIDEAENGLSFRNYKNLLIIGGGGHRTGKKGEGWKPLRELAKKYYPNSTEKYHWATQDCMSLDGVPYIGNYSASTPDLFVATGFNKWGMTSAMVSATILCDLVQGKENKYSEIFSPSRTVMRPQLAVNLIESTVNLLNPSTRRCPHLGCALKWNSVEHTWDCPCHGSRFTKEGKLIDNPATGDIKKGL